MANDMLRVSDGLATFGEDQLCVLRRLDDALVARAKDCGAKEMAFPALTSVADLDRIDYFVNFPHLGLAAVPLRRESLPEISTAICPDMPAIPSGMLDNPAYFLPSAACYPVYSHLTNRILTETERITTVQRCFRNEDHYEGLARLWGFTMREIVFVGSQGQIKEFLADHKTWILRFAEGAGLRLMVRVATDPFFETAGERAKMQRLFPVKEEFVYDDSVAVSSVNFHRNFFAERWNIRTPDSHYAFSGCVAFGLERWFHALARRYDDDCDAMVSAVDAGKRNAASGFNAVKHLT